MKNNNFDNAIPTKTMLEVKDIKARYGIGNDKAYSLVRRKDFPAFKLYGRFVISYPDLLVWEQNNMQNNRVIK